MPIRAVRLASSLLRRLSPCLHYWVASVFHLLKGRLVAWRHPKLVRTGPRIVLVTGEDGPDKLSVYVPVYAVYETLRPRFDVELSVHARFTGRAAKRIAGRSPDLVLLSFDSGRWQEAFESYGIPLVGSSSDVCRLCYDKVAAKERVRDLGITTAPHGVVRRGEPIGTVPERLGLPVVVKPRRGGSSQGLSRVDVVRNMSRAVRRALRWDAEALVEAYVPGKEYTCTVYGNDSPKTLPVCRKVMAFERAEILARGEEAPPSRFPVLSEEPFVREIRECSIEIYRTFGCRDMIRIDWKVDRTTEALVFLELNTLPWIGRGARGNIEACAVAAGSSYDAFILDLFRGALRRCGRDAAR
jgi:D-alanine-D-alanine ligase